MNENIIPRPPIFLAAMVFLYLSLATTTLNVIMIEINGSYPFNSSIYYFLYCICLFWLFFLIYKGYNWARFYFLIIFIVLLPQYVSFIMEIKVSLNSLLQINVTIFLEVLSLLLLFSKGSSFWFKLIKPCRNKKNIVNNKFKISSICFYFALGIIILYQFTLVAKVSSTMDAFFYDIILVNGFNVIVTIAINILIIIEIRKGRRLAGIIYLALIIITEYTPPFDPDNNHFLSIWNITSITIQVIAFIILFQTEIISFFNKLAKRRI